MRYITALLATSAILLTAACNTVEGVGEDVRAAGEAIDNTAEENNNYRHHHGDGHYHNQ